MTRWIPLPNNPQELEHVEFFNPYHQDHKENTPQEESENLSNNEETLYTLIPAASVRELFTSDKIIAIPFDVDYSGSEKKQRVVRRSIENQKQSPQQNENTSGHASANVYAYIPEKYDEQFNYDFPEPIVADYSALEKIETDEDEDNLSPSATIVDNEYRKKKTTVHLRNNVFVQ